MFSPASACAKKRNYATGTLLMGRSAGSLPDDASLCMHCGVALCATRRTCVLVSYTMMPSSFNATANWS